MRFPHLPVPPWSISQSRSAIPKQASLQHHLTFLGSQRLMSGSMPLFSLSPSDELALGFRFRYYSPSLVDIKYLFYDGQN
jgi:hypothetical protein